jgi:hypothetical protein
VSQTQPMPAAIFDIGGAGINSMHPLFGAAGNGTTDDRAALLAADAYALERGMPLIITKPHRCAAATVIQSPCVIRGGKIVPTGSQTVTINKMVDPGEQWVFDITNGYVITNGIEYMRMGWYGGGAGLTTTAAMTANRAAFNTMQWTNLPVRGNGSFYVNGPINWGNLPSGAAVAYGRRSSFKIIWRGAANRGMVEAVGTMYLDLTGVALECDDAFPAQFSLLAARPASLGSSDQHLTIGFHTKGPFSIANVVEIGSERNVHLSPHWENTSTSATATAWYRGPSIPAGLNVEYTAPVAMPEDGLNTTGTVVGGQVYASGNGVAAIIDDVDQLTIDGTNFYAANNRTLELRNGCRSLVLINNRHEVFTTLPDGPGNGTMSVYLATAGEYYIQFVGGSLSGGQTDYTIYGVANAELRKFSCRGLILTISHLGINVDKMFDSEVDGSGVGSGASHVTVRTEARVISFINCTTTLPASPNTSDIKYFPEMGASDTWTPGAVPPIGTGAPVHKSIAVGGAEIGDQVEASYSQNLGLLLLYAYIEATGTARVVLINPTTGSITPAAGTVYLTLRKKVWA